MDLASIITAAGMFLTAMGGLELFKWWRNRRADARKARAEAKKAEADAEKAEADVDNDKADYAGKIIEQADERVAQALADRARAFLERDKIAEEARKWQGKYVEERKAHYETKKMQLATSNPPVSTQAIR